MTAKLGRREFLELLCIGCAAHISGCSDCFGFNKFRKLRSQEHDYQMPTLLEVNNTNIARLILDLDYSFGKNGAISSMRNHGDYETAKERLETFLDMGNFWFPKSFLWGSNSITARAILTQIKDHIESKMLTYSQLPRLARQDSFCNLLLEMKYDCDTYSTLALGIAEKYHLPITGVLIPMHVFTRWQTEDACLNFDQGVISPNDAKYIDGSYSHYEKVYPLAPESLSGNSIYLKGLSKTEFVADYAAVIVYNLIENKEYTAALDLANSVKNWSPRDPFLHVARGTALRCLGYIDESTHEYETALKLDPRILG